MDTSVVAVVTDVIRDGRRVVGYGFNSNGRYAASGILTRRVIPRILQAEPESLLNDECSNLDPHRVWKVAMRNEKPGGHGERSVALGAVDMAISTQPPRSRNSLSTDIWRSDITAASTTPTSWSMPQAGTTTPARTSCACRTRCEGISISGTRS